MLFTSLGDTASSCINRDVSTASSSVFGLLLDEYPGKSAAILLAIAEIVSVSSSLYLLVLLFLIPFLPPGFDTLSSPKTKGAGNGTLCKDLIRMGMKDKTSSMHHSSSN